MATNYEIWTSDGQTKYEISENSINTDTSLTLIGHGIPQYGEDQNENFLHLLENFAHSEEPDKPIVGQLWFKKISSDSNDVRYELCVCKEKNSTGGVWDKVAIVSTGNDTPSQPSTGDIWYDTNAHALKIYDVGLNKWNVIGPQDTVHKEQINDNRLISNDTGRATTYTLSNSLFTRDIENSSDTKGKSGSASLVTMKIVAKEIFDAPISNKTPRSAAWIYKFLVQATKTEDGDYTSWNVDVVGGANYELIAMSDDAEWIVDLYKNQSSGEFVISVQDTGSILDESARIVVGFDIDIVRV